MYVLTTPEFRHWLCDEPAIAEPAYFEYFDWDSAADPRQSDFSIFETGYFDSEHDPETAAHMSGVQAYLSYFDGIDRREAVPSTAKPGWPELYTLLDRPLGAAFPAYRTEFEPATSPAFAAAGV